MAIAENPTTDAELQQYCLQTAETARAAAAQLALASSEQKNGWLRTAAKRIRDARDTIAAANQQDIQAAPDFGLTDAQIDRLRLTDDRLESIAVGLEDVAALPDPIGEVIESSRRPNGLEISKVRVPLGVVFFIYESRPNVTADAAAICLKSGNGVILRGGKEAAHSSRAIVDCLHAAAVEHDLPTDALQLVRVADRAAVGHFLKLNECIDVAIPRGGEGLIRRVSQEATMPVIKHFTGNCHVFVHRSADLAMAEQIVLNAKCQRMGVCNACESILLDAPLAESWLPKLVAALQDAGIEIRGCPQTLAIASGAGLEVETATEEDWGAEYLGPKVSLKIVADLAEAVTHINRYGSHHTDAIVTTELAAARRFTAAVDSAAVMVNASTRFNDGAEFGLGAEIGISTDRFHARGPCGLRELTSYKYIVYGDGQIRG